MKYLMAIIISSVLLLSGCVSLERKKKAEPEDIALQQEKKPESIQKDDVYGEEEGEKIIEAIEYAFSLETLIWDKNQHITKREDVVRIFRRGFCERKAEEITDYVWIEAVDRSGKKVYMLNPGEPLFTLPDSIEVLSEGRMNAIALLRYGENLTGPVTWEGHTIVATMKKESGVWKICETRIEEAEG